MKQCLWQHDNTQWSKRGSCFLVFVASMLENGSSLDVVKVFPCIGLLKQSIALEKITHANHAICNSDISPRITECLNCTEPALFHCCYFVPNFVFLDTVV